MLFFFIIISFIAFPPYVLLATQKLIGISVAHPL